jgi:2,4-dienoyl-CoA reductase-like NADH-dependent reductase (Old Yellow Enzyme family)/NADPH-dependent 2,4-dienoyl-CoA reductase/sulfur reductase-like enzyme
MTRHSHLLSPGRIGSLELRNRILMCPMGDDLAAESSYVTDAKIAYFEARARGGAALLLVGSVGITAPEGLSTPRQSAIADDSYIEGWARLADRVHAHGAKLALQLVHNGKAAVCDIVAGRPLLVPSLPKPPSADPLMGMLTDSERESMGTPMQVKAPPIQYRVMTREDIARVAEQFADAAERARRAGADACELHAGHGYLIDNFLSPTTNHRDDEYGGSVEKRARFLVEILHAIRRRVGRDFTVWCRINGEEFFTEGETLADACRVAELAEAAGADALHVSTYADPSRAIGYSEAHSTHTPGKFLPHAAAIKARVRIPIIAVGRISPDLAEETIAAGHADFVAMGRKLLADPELPNKLAAGTPEDVRPCIYLYRCISQIFQRDHVLCVSNPLTGRETEIEIEAARVAKRVLVVGGGPAGMEAARVAALRGHRVTLVERSSALGGRFALAARTAEPNADLLAWLLRQVEKRGVEVVLGVEARADEIAAQGWDAVFVATGARWDRPALPGAQLAHVWNLDALSAWLLDDSSRAAQKLVVLGGNKAGLALAGVARTRGASAVTVLEAGGVFAASVGLVGRWRYVHEAREQGIELIPNVALIRIDDKRVTWRGADGREQSTLADRVLVTSGATPDPSLAEQLRARGVNATALGDCREVRLIEGAFLDATRAAAAL